MKNSTFNSIINFRSAKITLFFLCTLISCKNNGQQSASTIDKKAEKHSKEVVVGANRMYLYIKDLQDKNIGVVTNQTGIVKTEKGKYVHLVDTLLKKKIKLTKVFAPEHGFRGEADAGEVVKDGKDTRTGLPIVSLYGKNKKPTAEQLKGIDLMLFDLQDVGARFYTYISTLHYVMEACAEAHIPLIVLDRPNPNGHYIDGPVLQPAFNSLCFFAGTNVSMGRGTNKQFQIYGAPYFDKTAFHFTPKPNAGDKSPKFNGKVCYGEDLSKTAPLSQLNLTWLKKAFEQGKGVKTSFFTASFNKIAGNDLLKKQITEGKTEAEIRQSWQKDLDKFKEIRKKYLLYK